MPEAVVATTFADLLEQGAQQATGCLQVSDGDNLRSGRVFFNRNGKVYAVHVDGFLPRVAQRLVTAGMLDQAAYDDVVDAAGGDPLDPRIGSICVEKGYIESQVLDAIHRELLLSAVGAMVTWPGVTTRFRKGTTTDQFTVNGVSVGGIMKAVSKRLAHWNSIWVEIAPTVSVVRAVPVLAEDGASKAPNTPDVKAIIDVIDGHRTVDEIAGECGLTRFETGHLLHALGTAQVLHITQGESRAAFGAGTGQLVPETTADPQFDGAAAVSGDYIVPKVAAGTDPMRVPPVRKRTPAPVTAPVDEPAPVSEDDEMLVALATAPPPVALPMPDAPVAADVAAEPLPDVAGEPVPAPANLAAAPTPIPLPVPLAPAPTVPADAPADLASFFVTTPAPAVTETVTDEVAVYEVPVVDTPAEEATQPVDAVSTDLPVDAPVDAQVENAITGDLDDLEAALAAAPVPTPDALVTGDASAEGAAPTGDETAPAVSTEVDATAKALSKVEEAGRAAQAAADAVKRAEEEAARVAAEAAEAVRLAQEAAAQAARAKHLAELQAQTELALAEQRRADAEQAAADTALGEARIAKAEAEATVQRAQVRTADAEKDRRALGEVASDAARALDEAEAEVLSATAAEEQALAELQEAQRKHEQAQERLNGATMSAERARTRNSGAIDDLTRVDERLLQATDELEAAEQAKTDATDLVAASETRLGESAAAAKAAAEQVAAAKAALAAAEADNTTA